MSNCPTLVVAALVTAALGQPAPTTAADSADQTPRIDFRARTLGNGLKVISAVDRTSPTVSIQVWYRVGSKDDPEGRSGFAHLFEHLLFKSTKNMPSEMLDRLTEDVGGFNNAFTADDMTVYYEVVPSNYLETLLWAEADRMASLTVDQANFQSERDVVKEEYRQSYASSPYGKLRLLIEQRSFTAHPYRRPGIGNLDELSAAKLEDALSFHTTFYRPDNAVLVVVGDLEDTQLDVWVDKYFGRVGRPATPLPRVTVVEPPRSEPRVFVEYEEGVPLPAVALTYLIPPAKSADAPALEIVQTILANGESSRLFRSLVYRQQLAADVTAYADLREHTGLFVLRATLADGKSPAEGEQALLAELKLLRDVPIAAAELEKAKTQVTTGDLRQRETSDGKALKLGAAEVLLGDPEQANTYLARLEAVSAADVQRVTAQYLADAQRVAIHYLPEAARPPSGTAGVGNGGGK